MKRWQSDFQRGRQALSKHDAGSALVLFSRSLQDCPVSDRTSLSRILFYLGLALQRLGLANSAVHSWIAAQRTKKGQLTEKLLRRFANSYGMAKQCSCEQDDWQAFYSIQLMRYLRGFNKRTLTSETERCLLGDLIKQYWLGLCSSDVLEGKSPEEKCEIFKAARIDFPLFYLPQDRESLLRVDFQAKRRLAGSDRCFCGSGLPFLSCCGRTPGEDELSIGLF